MSTFQCCEKMTKTRTTNFAKNDNPYSVLEVSSQTNNNNFWSTPNSLLSCFFKPCFVHSIIIIIIIIKMTSNDSSSGLIALEGMIALSKTPERPTKRCKHSKTPPFKDMTNQEKNSSNPKPNDSSKKIAVTSKYDKPSIAPSKKTDDDTPTLTNKQNVAPPTSTSIAISTTNTTAFTSSFNKTEKKNHSLFKKLAPLIAWIVVTMSIILYVVVVAQQQQQQQQQQNKSSPTVPSPPATAATATTLMSTVNTDKSHSMTKTSSTVMMMKQFFREDDELRIPAAVKAPQQAVIMMKYGNKPDPPLLPQNCSENDVSFSNQAATHLIQNGAKPVVQAIVRALYENMMGNHYIRYSQKTLVLPAKSKPGQFI